MVDIEGFEPGDGEKIAGLDTLKGIGERATAWTGTRIMAQGEYVPSGGNLLVVAAEGAEKPIWLGAQSVNSMNHVRT